MSLLSIATFFPRHATTEACNLVIGAENFDVVLANLSSAVCYFLIIPTFYIGARAITPTKARYINVFDDFLTGDEAVRINETESPRRENVRRITLGPNDSRETLNTSWLSYFTAKPTSTNLLSESTVSSKRVSIVRMTDAFFAEDVRKELKKIETFSPVTCLSLSESRIVSGHEDEKIRVFNIVTSIQEKVLIAHDGRVTSVAFSGDGSKIVSSSVDKTIRIWNASTGDILQEVVTSSIVSCVVFYNSSDRIISAGFDHTIRIFDSGLVEVLKLVGHKAAVSAVSVSQNDQYIASGSNDFSVRIWNVSSGQQIRELRGHSNSVRTVAFHSENSMVASAGSDSNIIMWNIHSGEILMRLKGHTAAINSVCFSLDGASLISGSSDKSIRVWHLDLKRNSGTEVLLLEGHQYSVSSVVYDYNKNRVISGGDDGTIRKWNAAVSYAVKPNTVLGFAKRVNMSILKICSRLFAWDAILLSLINAWLSAMRVSFLKESSIQLMIHEWNKNKEKEERTHTEEKMINLRCEDLRYDGVQFETDICFANFFKKRTIEETRKWKEKWNSKVLSSSSLLLSSYSLTPSSSSLS
jgi:WD40 repeat protein